MLLAISDLHLTDETVSDAGVRPAALGTVLQDLASATEAHNQRGGTPINRLDVLLLGDVFDLLRTKYWADVPESECPWSIELITDGNWDSPAAARVIQHAGKILDAILGAPNAAGVCTALLNAAARGLGPFTTVRVHLVTGNHDRLVNHRAAGSLRAKVRAATGARADDDQALFPRFLYLEDYAAFARHGHEFDPWNFEPVTPGVWDAAAYERCPIGDPITFALATKLYLATKQALDPAAVTDAKTKLDRERFLSGLRAIEDVRPASMIPVWLKAYSQNHRVADEVGRVVARVAREFRELHYFDWWRRHSVWDTLNPFQTQDLFSGLIRLLANFKKIPPGRIGSLYKLYGQVEGKDSILPGMLDQEIVTQPELIRNSPVQHMLCGHSHNPGVSLATVIDEAEWARRCRGMKPMPEPPQDVAEPAGRQVWYLNTGTMRNRVLATGVSHLRFVPTENLSYAVIHRPGEKHAAGFAADLWSGTRAPIEI